MIVIRRILFFLTVIWIFGCVMLIYVIEYNQTLSAELQNFRWLEQYGLDFSKLFNILYKLKLNKIIPLHKAQTTTVYLKDINLTGQGAITLLTRILLYGAMSILVFFILEPLIKRALLIAIVFGVISIFLLEYSKSQGLISEFKWFDFLFSSTFFSAFALLVSLLSKFKRKI